MTSRTFHHVLTMAMLLTALGMTSALSAQDAAPLPANPSELDSSSVGAEGSSEAMRVELAALRARVEAMEAEREREKLDAEAARILAEAEAVPAAEELEEDTLKLYGFMDMGLSRTMVSDSSPLAVGRYSKSTTFLLGNINLYLDATPHPDWRGLLELRFSNLPHGYETNYTFAPTGTKYTRFNQRIVDVTNAGGPLVLLGSTIIERAWIQWQRYDALHLQLGYWLTPFGIWNVDHGQPTLIALLLPQFIANRYVVQQQLGVQALGTVFVGDWSLDYMAYVSNGRLPGQLDFTEDKAFGGRVVASTGRGNRLSLGGSFYWGRYSDQERILTEIDPVDLDPFVLESKETIAFDEVSAGADISYDQGPFRLRAETVHRRVEYEAGKHERVFGVDTLPAVASSFTHAGYMLAAYQLPFWGLEPYLYFEATKTRSFVGDYGLFPSLGFNVHITPRVMIKSQYIHGFFRDFRKTERREQNSDIGYAAARLVLSF